MELLTPLHLFSPFTQQILIEFLLCASTVLGPGDTAGSKTNKNPSSRGTYILKGGDGHQKRTKQGTCTLGPELWEQ